MRPLLKGSFMFKVSKNAKISFLMKSKNLAVVRVTNVLGFSFTLVSGEIIDAVTFSVHAIADAAILAGVWVASYPP